MLYEWENTRLKEYSNYRKEYRKLSVSEAYVKRIWSVSESEEMPNYSVFKSKIKEDGK